MEDAQAADELRRIEALLDERVGRHNMEDLTVFQRVQDVVRAFEMWSEMALRRLHELHQARGETCDFCPKYLGDGGG